MKVQFLDNVLSHKILPATSAALQWINTVLQHFPLNNIHLIQPWDSFVILKIKDTWTRPWEEKKLELMRDGE